MNKNLKKLLLLVVFICNKKNLEMNNVYTCIVEYFIFICTYIWKDLLHSDKYYTSNYITLNLLKSIGIVFIVCLIIDIIRKFIYSCTIEKLLKNNKIYNYELIIGGDVTDE